MIKTLCGIPHRIALLLKLLVLVPIAFVSGGFGICQLVMLLVYFLPRMSMDANLLVPATSSLLGIGVAIRLGHASLKLIRELEQETKSSEVFLSIVLLMAVFGLGMGLIAVHG